MRVVTSAEPADDAPPPHEAIGAGKIIRPGFYGHVEVTAIPRDSLEVSVEAGQVAFGHGIPPEERESVIAAARHVLAEAVSSGSLRCGVRLVIDHGSFHPQSRSAHAEATNLAVAHALRRGKFIREA